MQVHRNSKPKLMLINFNCSSITFYNYDDNVYVTCWILLMHVPVHMHEGFSGFFLADTVTVSTVQVSKLRVLSHKIM